MILYFLTTQIITVGNVGQVPQKNKNKHAVKLKFVFIMYFDEQNGNTSFQN